MTDPTSLAPRPQTWIELCDRLSPQRQERLKKVASLRSNYVRLVVQDIHHPHNVSACMRSAEAFGVLNVDVVTMREKFKPSTVTKGSTHWLRLHRYHEVSTCAAQLKAQGYRLAAGFPDPNAAVLDELPIDQPIAVIFGNEADGVHPDWRPHLDLKFTIPMAGMVESLNISVSTAITLYSLTQRAQRTIAPDRYYLTSAEQDELLGEWARRQLYTP